MENLTTTAPCDDDCDCVPDAAQLADFSRAIHALGGKWKLDILSSLMHGAMRFGALRRSVAGITQHMLTTQLRELEQDGLVSRTAFAGKPLRVEYELTDAAYGLEPAFKELLSWSRLYRGARLATSQVTREA